MESTDTSSEDYETLLLAAGVDNYSQQVIAQRAYNRKIERRSPSCKSRKWLKGSMNLIKWGLEVRDDFIFSSISRSIQNLILL